MVSRALVCGGRRGTQSANLNVLPSIGNFFLGFVKVFQKMNYSEVFKTEAAKEFRLTCPAGENNWKSRQAFCSSLADAVEKYGKKDLPVNFVDTIEPYLNNLLDCAISERTVLAVQGCRAVGSLPKVLGKDIHPLIDRILPVMVRHCASTKAVNQKSAAAAISNIVVHSTYSGRLLWHICQAFEDKYTAPKVYAPGWLKLLLQEYHASLHPDRDFDTISRAIAIGLQEADNNVRVNSRAVFWEYHKIDPTGAEEVMTKINPHARTALINDPNNPDKKSTKAKGKKQTEQEQSLAQIRQQAKDRLKQKAVERERITSAKTITSEDFVGGPFKMGDDQQSSASASAKPMSQAPLEDQLPLINKSASRPISGHKKGQSQDGPIPHVTKKASSVDMAAPKPKKTGSVDNLHTSQTKKASSAIVESSNSRPLLSGPVRRPRIVATPINAPQSSSRPSSRTGVTQPNVEQSLRSAVSHRELKSSQSDHPASLETQPKTSKPSKKISRSELNSPVLVPEGKENANIYTLNRPKPVDASPTRLIVRPARTSPSPPTAYIIHKMTPDSLSTSQRLHQQKLQLEMDAVKVKPGAFLQEDEQNTQMHRAYPQLNHDGQIDDARRALSKALEYLKKDALDRMGIRKLRKMLEQFGGELIVDQALYDLLFTELLTRLGTFEELLVQPVHEISNEGHPRYIRSAVLTMVNILVTQYPFQWSYEYQGPALAAIMIARCCYSVNADPHDGAPYRHPMGIVDQINRGIVSIIGSCMNPVDVLDSVIQVLVAGEDFLVRHAPHDSETQKSWASFNPYSKINRLRTEKSAYFHPIPENLSTFDNVDPKPLPMKLPLLMETALIIIQNLISKATMLEFKLGEEREDVLADLARHLLGSYNIIIRRNVMDYCQILYVNFSSQERFWSHFTKDSERNLLHYYIERMR